MGSNHAEHCFLLGKNIYNINKMIYLIYDAVILGPTSIRGTNKLKKWYKEGLKIVKK